EISGTAIDGDGVGLRDWDREEEEEESYPAPAMLPGSPRYRSYPRDRGHGEGTWPTLRRSTILAEWVRQPNKTLTLPNAAAIAADGRDLVTSPIESIARPPKTIVLAYPEPTLAPGETLPPR